MSAEYDWEVHWFSALHWDNRCLCGAFGLPHDKLRICDERTQTQHEKDRCFPYAESLRWST